MKEIGTQKIDYQVYLISIIYSLIIGIIFINLSINYSILSLIASLFIMISFISKWKFEFALLIFCIGLLFVTSITPTKSLTFLAILFLILIISCVLSGNKFDINVSVWKENLSKIILLYFGWELLQLILSTNYMPFYQIARGAILLLILFAIFYITSAYIKKLNNLYYIVAILLICASSESVLAILQHFSSNFYITPTNVPRNPNILYPREYLGYIFPFISIYVREARGTFGQLNGLGNFLTLFFPLALAIAFIREIKGIMKYLFWLVNITIFLGLYFTYSRGSLSGVILGLFLVIILVKRKSGKRELKTALIFFLLPLGLMCIYSLAGIISEYYINTQNWTTRLLLWSETLSKIKESLSTFLFGTHYFSHLDDKFFQQFIGWTPLGHNSYLAIWESRGIIGLILLVLLIVFSIRNFYSSYKKTHNLYIKHTSIGLIAGLTAFLISQLFDHKLAYFFNIRYYFFMILGISIGMKRIVENNIIRTV